MSQITRRRKGKLKSRAFRQNFDGIYIHLHQQYQKEEKKEKRSSEFRLFFFEKVYNVSKHYTI